MNDFVIADISVHLAASKNMQYRQSIMQMYGALTTFLQHNGLLTHQLLAPGELPTEKLRIMRSDLSEKGFEFLKLALHRWVKGITSGKWKADDITFLQKELDRFNQSRPK